MKTTIIVILLIIGGLSFSSCKKCEWCITNESITVTGDSTAPLRTIKTEQELCGEERRAAKDDVVIITVKSGNTIIHTTKTTTCAAKP